MTQMIKSKAEFICSKCGAKYIKWSGICYRGCKFQGTIEKKQLIEPKVKPQQASSAKRLQRRAKDSERGIARRMLEVDGADPLFRNIASSTGRIGFITGMQIDAVSRTYVTENKNRKMPSWLILAWTIINQKANEFGKNALLHVEPPNMPKTYLSQGVTHKLSTMAIITQDRHEELIEHEKMLAELMMEINGRGEYAALQVLYVQLLQKNKTK